VNIRNRYEHRPQTRLEEGRRVERCYATNPRSVCSQVGSRAGASSRGSARRPRCSRTRRTCDGSTTVARTRIRPSHLAHRKASKPNVRRRRLIPLLGEDFAAFAPPSLEVGTCRYGAVMLKNDADRPTIVPPGAGWVVRQKAQGHAIGGGALLEPGQSRLIETALCIQ